MIDTSQIVGHGADADPSKRPGIPREHAPRMAPGAITPTRQQSDVRIFQDRPDDAIPPVYGTAQPPKGLSGALRKAAYAYPAHWTRHWMMLLVADRVSSMEHRLTTVRGIVPLAGLLLAGGLAVTLLRRRSSQTRARLLGPGDLDEGIIAPT